MNQWVPWAIIADLLLMAGVGAGGYLYRAHEDEGKVRAAVQERISQEDADHIKFMQDVATDERRLQDAYDKVNADLSRERQARVAAAHALAAADDGLRVVLEKYTGLSGIAGIRLPTVAEPATGPDAKARTIGVLYEDLDRFAGSCAIEADRLTEQVIGLQALLQADQAPAPTP